MRRRRVHHQTGRLRFPEAATVGAQMPAVRDRTACECPSRSGVLLSCVQGRDALRALSRKLPRCARASMIWTRTTRLPINLMRKQRVPSKRHSLSETVASLAAQLTEMERKFSARVQKSEPKLPAPSKEV